jgi:predicted aminopeptidase
LLVAGVVAIILELVLMTVWGLAVARRTQELTKMVETEQAGIQADLERLKQTIEEIKRRWQPYRRILRWVRHPLVLAVLGSYRRRWAR